MSKTKSWLKTKGWMKKKDTKKWLKTAVIIAYLTSMFVDFLDLTAIGIAVSLPMSVVCPILLYAYSPKLFKSWVGIVAMVELIPFVGVLPLELVIVYMVWKN